MTVAQIQTNPTNLDLLDKINEIIRNLLYVDDSTVKIIGGVISAVPPIGTVYVQFPGKSAPADLYGGEWTNISAQFAGQFFRCEGGNAAAFGSSQNGGAPNIYGESRGWCTAGTGLASSGAIFDIAYAVNQGASTNTGWSGRFGFSAAKSNGYYNANEFRPYNTAIRIWKRTE